MKQADTIVIGSPLYWHNICGSVRNVLDRFYGKVEDGSLSGRKLYFVFQGAAPEKWMLDAGEYTMKRFAGLYGMTYGGMATNKNDAAKLKKRFKEEFIMEYAVLNNGVKMPMAGIGTFLFEPGRGRGFLHQCLTGWLPPDRHGKRLHEREGRRPRHEEVRLAAGGDFPRNQTVAQLL